MKEVQVGDLRLQVADGESDRDSDDVRALVQPMGAEPVWLGEAGDDGADGWDLVDR